MNTAPDIICAGSVLWDMIGRSALAMQAGDDRPGRITRLPGGVALNIAMTLVKYGLRPALLSVVGQDSDGRALISSCQALGLNTDHVLRRADLPTDRYMAIESQGRLLAAIADAHSLEAAGAAILAPLRGGALAPLGAPFTGLIALDGNLPVETLALVASHEDFAKADLRLAPASPGKATRLLPFLQAGRGTLYVNLEEAGLLCGTRFCGAQAAAQGLIRHGARRALVTDGGQPAADADEHGLRSARPPAITAQRVTGAGDTFMAAHIAAERAGTAPQAALETALRAAAHYVSGKETP